MVKSIRTGDTLNILSTNYILINDPSAPLLLVSDSDPIGKISGYTSHDREIPKGRVDELEPIRFETVFYDSEFIQANVYHYPALTGGLVSSYAKVSTGTSESAGKAVTDGLIESIGGTEH